MGVMVTTYHTRINPWWAFSEKMKVGVLFLELEKKYISKNSVWISSFFKFFFFEAA
jgi:hypothetical protein